MFIRLLFSATGKDIDARFDLLLLTGVKARTTLDAPCDLSREVIDHADVDSLGNVRLRSSRSDLYTLYGGWLARIETLNAARLTGAFNATDDGETVGRRREALDAHASLTKEIEILCGKAKREKQLALRVSLNVEIRSLEHQIQFLKANL